MGQDEDERECSSMELAERWRIVGMLLRRIDPTAFEALLHGAEVMVVATVDEREKINEVYLNA